MNAHNRIAPEWDMFAALVLSGPVSQIQRDETRKAFYAGFACALKVLENIGDLPDDQAVPALTALTDELSEHVRGLIAEAFAARMAAPPPDPGPAPPNTPLH